MNYGRNNNSPETGYFRPAGVIEVKSAIDGEGKLILWEFDNYHSGRSAVETQRIEYHASIGPSQRLLSWSGRYRQSFRT